MEQTQLSLHWHVTQMHVFFAYEQMKDLTSYLATMHIKKNNSKKLLLFYYFTPLKYNCKMKVVLNQLIAESKYNGSQIII